MIILRCTAKLRKEMGVSDSDLVAREDDGFLGSWYANLLRIDRRKYLLVTNALTLYSFIVPSVRRSDLRDMSTMFALVLLENLKAEGIGDTDREAIRSECAQVLLSRTVSKSVLGSMNDLAYQIDVAVRIAGGLAACDPVVLTRQLNRTPMGAIGYAYPIDRVREELRVST